MASEMVKVDGLSSAFLRDAKYSVGENIARRSLIELQNLGVNERNRVLEEERSREANDAIMRHQAQGNRDIRDGLREIGSTLSALSEGNDQLSAVMMAVGDQISGIPRRTKDIHELLNNGSVDEAEIIILAGKGALDRDQTRKFFDSLDNWKIWIISNGLVKNDYVQSGKSLTAEEEDFIDNLSRKSRVNPIELRSFSVLWREGILDEEFRSALAKNNPNFRSGLDAVRLEVRDVGRDLREGTSILISNTRSIAADTNELVDQGAAELRLAEEGNEISRDSRDVQRASLEVSEGVLREIRNLGNRAENAEDQRGAMISLALVAENDRQAIINGICNLIDDGRHSSAAAQDTRLAQLRATDHFGSIQVAQMSEAQEARLAQLDRIRHSGELQAMQMAAAQDTRLAQLRATDHFGSIQVAQMSEAQEARLAQLDKLSDLESVLKEIAIAQSMNHDHAMNVLGDLGQMLSGRLRSIVQVVETVRQALMDMEARAIDREQNSEKNMAQQSFRKAIAMLRVGHIDKAIKFFNESEDRWPEDFRVYFQRGLCYIVKGDPRAAESDFSDAIEFASGKNEARTRALIRHNLARLYYGEAKVHLSDGNQSEYMERLQVAIAEGRRAVDEDPKYLEAQFGLAVYLAANKSFDEALKILLKIIPKNAEFIKKIDDFDVLTPLREALKNAIGDNIVARENISISEANLDIARDYMELGDFENARKRLNFLFEKDPEYLRQSKIWEMNEFAILNKDIAEMIKRFLGSADKHEYEWGYALIGIALNYLSEVGRGAIYSAFKNAIERDPDFQSSDARKITQRCIFFAGDKIATLFTIIRSRLKSDLPEWFINSL